MCLVEVVLLRYLDNQEYVQPHFDFAQCRLSHADFALNLLPRFARLKQGIQWTKQLPTFILSDM